MPKLTKLTNYLILLFLFALPWQTRWIYGSATLNGRPWEYGTLSFYGTEILLWAIIIFTGVRLFGNKEFWKELASRSHFSRRWPALLIAAGLAIFVGYYYAVSPVKEISTQFLSRLVGAICLYICLAVSALDFRKMSLAFWSGAVVQGFLAVWQFFAQSILANKWLGLAAQKAADSGAAVVETGSERWLRAYGSFGWPNSLGVFLAAALLIGAILLAGSSKKYWPYILAGQMIIFTGLVFTFSRGAWLALAVGLLFYFFLVLKQKNKFALLTLVKQIFAFVLVAATLLIAYFPLFSARASAGGYLEKLSLGERAAQYQVAKEIIFTHPVSGIGPGLYTYYLADNYQAPAYGVYQPVHNIYLLAASELGVAVFMCLIVFLVLLIEKIWKKQPLFLAVIVVVLVAGLFDHYLWSMYTGLCIFWAIFGLGLAKNDKTKELSASHS